MRTLRFLWVFLCMTALIGPGITLPATGLDWEQYTTADGLISNTVSSLFKADDGSVWIGLWVGPWGDPGLNQYVDGEILTWDSGTWAPTNVTGICQDNVKRIWACSYDRGCVFLDEGLWNEGFYWSPTEPPLAHAGVKCDSEGRLWAAFSSGIMYYSPATHQSVRVWTAPPGIPGIRFLFIDAKDHIWFSLTDVSFSLIRMDQEGNELSSYPWMFGQVCRSADGTIWLGRASLANEGNWFGVGRLEGSQFVSVSPPAGSFPAEPGCPICVTAGGEIVTGSYGWDSCGIFIYDGANWQYNKAPFDSPDTPTPISAVISDRAGDIWVGTDSGLWVLRRGKQPDVVVDVSVNSSSYAVAQRMTLLLDVTSAQAQTVDLYVAIQLPAGDVLFYPSLGISWSAFWPGLVIPAGTDVERYELFSLTLPELPAGTYRWFAACTYAGAMDFASNIASCEWEFVR